MITVTVSVKDYLERLKYIQSHTRKYKQHMREFRSKEEANEHQTYNRTVLGIMDMLSNTVTIDYDEHNRPKSRVSDDIDRMIIGQKLAVVISLDNGSISLCHTIANDQYPFITLRHYIRYMEFAIKEGKLSKTDQYHLLSPDDGFLVSDVKFPLFRVYLSPDSSYCCPIVDQSLSIYSNRINLYKTFLNKDLASDLAMRIHMKSQEIAKESRKEKKHDRSNSTNSESDP